MVALIPLGTCGAERTTTSAAPNTGEVSTWIVVVPPMPIEALAGSAERAKSLSMTTTVARAEKATPSGDTAVTSNCASPVAALSPAAIVSVAVCPGKTTEGVGVAENPGTCATDNCNCFAAAVPRKAAVAMVTLVDPPRTTVCRTGEVHTARSVAVVHPGSWKVTTRVCQLNRPSTGMYSLVYQK